LAVAHHMTETAHLYLANHVLLLGKHL